MRLLLLKQQAASGQLVLLFEDESEALTHPYLSHVWAQRGSDIRVEAPGQSKKRAILGVHDAATGGLGIITSDTKRSSDFVRLLEEVVDERFGPRPGQSRPEVVLVLDNGPIHTSKVTTKALAQRPWLRVEWLPKYAPELNDIERDWRHLKRHYLANQVVNGVTDLDQRIHAGVQAINEQRVGRSRPMFAKAA